MFAFESKVNNLNTVTRIVRHHIPVCEAVTLPQQLSSPIQSRPDIIFLSSSFAYLDLTLSNHKESPLILLEMEEISQVGLDKVREKLFLASTRQSTLVEDMAYSLYGIFNVAIPVIYGEGDCAVGRLLEHILTGDFTVLAWTGSANSHNSCLPKDLTVYNELVPPHLPPSVERAEMDQIVPAELSIPNSDLTLVVKLYDQLNALPTPFLASSRLRLPGIVFHINDVARVSGPDPTEGFSVYRVTTTRTMLGDLMTDLTSTKTLYLVHPWVRPLLDRDDKFSRTPGKADKPTLAVRYFAFWANVVRLYSC